MDTAIIEVILISLGLAMDAFAVAISSGVIIMNLKLRHALRIAFFFGVFQGVMPLIGWAAGTVFSDYIQAYDHWIAFGLLLLIGGKMIYESRDCELTKDFNPLDIYVLFSLSIATSIDALAVGVTFSVLGVTIWSAAAIIGMITFFMALIGVKIGDYFGDFCGNKIEIAGGVILISIGFKILIQHLYFHV